VPPGVDGEEGGIDEDGDGGVTGGGVIGGGVVGGGGVIP
jgi:hypothetical protein